MSLNLSLLKNATWLWQQEIVSGEHSGQELCYVTHAPMIDGGERLA